MHDLDALCQSYFHSLITNMTPRETATDLCANLFAKPFIHYKHSSQAIYYCKKCIS